MFKGAKYSHALMIANYFKFYLCNTFLFPFRICIAVKKFSSSLTWVTCFFFFFSAKTASFEWCLGSKKVNRLMQAGAWRGVACGCNLIHDFKFPFEFIEQWTQKNYAFWPCLICISTPKPQSQAMCTNLVDFWNISWSSHFKPKHPS